jgi:hypothetical protein
MIDQELGNKVHSCPKVISSLLEAEPELASGNLTARIASHWTAAACAVLPTFSSLSEDCGTYTMPCGGGEPIQMHSISDFGSENVQTRTETFPNMKILPVRITTDFFLNHLL